MNWLKIFVFPLVVTFFVVFAIEFKLTKNYEMMIDAEKSYVQMIEKKQSELSSREAEESPIKSCYQSQIQVAEGNLIGFPMIFSGFRLVAYLLCFSLFIAAYLAYKQVLSAVKN